MKRPVFLIPSRTLHPIPLNPLSAQLNPICNLLALLGTQHILHVSRTGVKSVTTKYIAASVV